MTSLVLSLPNNETTMTPGVQPQFFLYRFCLELDAQVRDTTEHSSLQFCTVRVPSYIQISLLKTTSFLSGAYIHDDLGVNVSPGFGKLVSTAWASFLEREAVVFHVKTRAPAFLTQGEWDFIWKHTRRLTLILPRDLLQAFNSQFSRKYDTFHLLAATINTFVLPQYVSRDESVRKAFRDVWNHSSLIRDTLGWASLSRHGNALPAPVSAMDCRDTFLKTLFSNLDRGIEFFGSSEAWQGAVTPATDGETKEILDNGGKATSR